MKVILYSTIMLLLAGFFLVSCTKQANVTPAILAHAGPDQYLVLPTSSATLTGTVTQGQAPDLTYSWSEISGPSNPVIANSTAATASVSNLVVGTYVFQFQAENSEGTIIGLDTMSIFVTVKSITLQPANNSYEGIMVSLNPTTFEEGDAHQLLIGAWTYTGTFYTMRTCIKFDFSTLPAGAVIDHATLTLYSSPAPIDGDKVNAQSGTGNACFIQRITSSWTLPTPFTPNNPPTITTTNEAVIPQSTSATETDVVDVTALAQDIQTNGNNGFNIMLQNEAIYNIRQYASSYNSDATVRPKLVILYH